MLLCIQQPFIAQNFQKNISHYSFIKYDYNKIQIPGKDSSRINLFFQKLDTLIHSGKGKINILHIGGSHVQADMFSHQVRENLDSINPDIQIPRGFIFPFSVAKTNNPTNYKVSYKGTWNTTRNVQKELAVPLGVSGIAVHTNDPEAEISVDLNPGDITFKRWYYDRLKLLGYTKDGSRNVKPLLQYDDTVWIEGVYDSISRSFSYELPKFADSFTIRFLQEDSIPHTFILDGFIADRDTTGIVYHAIGVNGASVPSYLKSEHFEDELQLLKPDLVIFGIGINDAASKDFTDSSFHQNYNSLIERIEKVSPDCAYIFITNNDSFKRIRKNRYEVNRNGLIARKTFYALAEEHQGGVWDLFSLMGGLRSMQKWQIAGLSQRDKIHFTKTGYQLLGDLLFNALMDYYQENHTSVIHYQTNN